MILVTGGAGFIGANFVLDWLAQSDEAIVNLDKLTYAGSLTNVAEVADFSVGSNTQNIQIVMSGPEAEPPSITRSLASSVSIPPPSPIRFVSGQCRRL